MQAWDWRANVKAEFDFNQTEPVYPAQEGRWAVVVGASDNWVSYRHQADALAMYQLLRRHGYADDRIILIMEDNIAYNEKNKNPGEVRVRVDGENLYNDVHTDYKLSDIDFDDLCDIMLGNSSYRLQNVIKSGPADNVIMFWCGHGSKGALAWGSNGPVDGFRMSELISTMHEQGKYRKMFFALDACYSGTIGVACTGIPGLAVMTAASPYEPSKADMKDTEMCIWLSNGFTRAFQEAVDADTGISLRDLYYTCARHTVGSHAMLYNTENYGNVYRNTMAEYLLP